MDISKFTSHDSPSQLALQVIGAINAIAILYKLLDFVYFHFLRSSQLKEYLIDPKSPEASKTQNASGSSETKSWALVTGASDGIVSTLHVPQSYKAICNGISNVAYVIPQGKVLAHQLAQAGFNVVLHGRNPTKLDGVLRGLQEANPRTHFRVLVADASNSHGMKSAITSMADNLNALPGPLTILINNVGGTAPTPRIFMPLRELEHAQVDGLIALNARFATQLTRALLPCILTRNADLGAKAVIINVGSAAHIGVPMQSVYGGSKGFLRTFTCALARELRMEGYKGVTAMYTVVGHVTNAGPWKEPPTLFTPTAVTLARSLLHKVGCGRIEVTPFWSHAFQVYIANTIPEWLLTRFATDEVRKDIAEEERKAKKA